jgi:two-component system, NtrC family, sensor histidine kinase GlrK
MSEPLPVAPTVPSAAPVSNRPYPRSFFRFLILAFVLVTAPLVVSLIQLTLEANDQAAGSGAAVRKVAAVLKNVESLEPPVTQMERLVRQALALNEPVPLDLLDSAHVQFGQVAAKLLDPALSEGVVNDAQALVATEKALVQALRANPRVLALPPALDLLSEQLTALSDAGNRTAAREIGVLQASYVQARRHALVALAVALPLALVLAGVFTVALARPLTRIEDAIRAMGAGRLQERIQIGGPRDVRLLGERLDWLRTRLSDLESYRELLTRSISHDLKTPLTSMVEGLELLRQNVAGPLSPRQAEVVDIMADSAHALSDKIGGLLTVRSGALRDSPVDLRPVELRELVLAVVSHHRLVALGKQLDVQVLGAEIRLSADGPKLRVVFDNLMSNAIRFSPQGGGIDIELALHGDQARVTVADDGPGVPLVDVDRIFDPGYRAKHQPEHAVGGSGVGLSIAREFVLAHGGQLRVAGAQGRRRGAHLQVSLPSALPEIGHTLPPSARAQRAAKKPGPGAS